MCDCLAKVFQVYNWVSFFIIVIIFVRFFPQCHGFASIAISINGRITCKKRTGYFQIFPQIFEFKKMPPKLTSHL